MIHLTNYIREETVELKIKMKPEEIPPKNYNHIKIKVNIDDDRSATVDKNQISGTDQFVNFITSSLKYIASIALSVIQKSPIEYDDILELVETYDIYLNNTYGEKPIDDSFTVKNLIDNTDPDQYNLEVGEDIPVLNIYLKKKTGIFRKKKFRF